MNLKIIFAALILLAYFFNRHVQVRAGSPGLDSSPGAYELGSDGRPFLVTNADLKVLWPGVWKDDTNGLRVQLSFMPEEGFRWLRVSVGSIRFNSPGVYLGPPGSTFQKFELRSTNGIVVPFLSGQTLESVLAPRLRLKQFPRWPGGSLKSHISFFTNGGPSTLADIDLKKVYRIPKESDYVLTVCAVIYKFGTNIQSLDRVDLPCLSAQVHLRPWSGGE